MRDLLRLAQNALLNVLTDVGGTTVVLAAQTLHELNDVTRGPARFTAVGRDASSTPCAARKSRSSRVAVALFLVACDRTTAASAMPNAPAALMHDGAPVHTMVHGANRIRHLAAAAACWLIICSVLSRARQ
jgi:hypothetical protein